MNTRYINRFRDYSMTGEIAAFFLVLAAFVFGIVGYIWNIFKLVSQTDTIGVVEAMIRMIGIFAAPIGVLMGYL